MADSNLTGVELDREILDQAHAAGPMAVLGAYLRLSGPGFLQSAITLGGGSLAGALFLGILGGPSMLWLQLVAILMGVVMLSAISYVTLSTGERPFGLINRHVNPVLGWGWIVATCMANIIFCLPQFSLCYDALDRNLVPGGLGESSGAKYGVSFTILLLACFVLYFNVKGGATAKVFDWFLKALIAMIVLCFFGVVIVLSSQGVLDWGQIFAGFIPDLSQWIKPAGELRPLLDGLSQEAQQYWRTKQVGAQRSVMIGAAATAVGINMTFLMPYSLLQRGWDKTFRGLARFDLGLGMAIPYVLVTSCVVIAAGQAFHAQADEEFLSNDVATFTSSPLYAQTSANLQARVRGPSPEVPFDKLDEAEQNEIIAQMASLPEEEKRIASSLVKRNAFALSSALSPLLGKSNANLIFGLGVFGMGFSTIIILMLINGFVFCEAFDKPRGSGFFVLGCLIAGIAGAVWPSIWTGGAQFWLAIFASSFGIMLLPIAYITFFMLMNSHSVLGDDRPRGGRRLLWNLLMGVSVVGALAAAGTALWDKISATDTSNDALAGKIILGVAIVYGILVLVGFQWRTKDSEAS